VKLKIGVDIHGVADEMQDFFQVLTKTLVDAGHEVHIITGPPMGPRLKAEIERLGISFTHVFSITDHHLQKGTPVEWVGDNPYMDEYLWDKTKGEYCKSAGIQLHLDDSDAYGYFFKTPYARVFSKNKRKHYVKP
jgi:acid phosphatase class B